MRVDRESGDLVIEVDSEAETAKVGRAVGLAIVPGVVIGLVGGLGAGKTRLSRAIAEALGVPPAAIASPTFVLIHEYEGRFPVYHFDTYRLDDPDAFEALGAADYFEAGGICLIEWADRVLDLLPSDAWWLTIEATGFEGRRFRLRLPEDRALAIAEALAGSGD